MKNLFSLVIIICISISLDSSAQSGRSKKRKKIAKKITPVIKKNITKVLSYSKFVNKNTKTDKGLFSVHETKDKFYYEIPDKLLNKEFLLVTRLKGIPAGLGGGYVNAGTKINTQVVVWEKFKNKILLKVKSYEAIA